MPKYETKNPFHRTESRVLISENDDDAHALVGWLLEKSDKIKDDVLSVREEITKIIYDEDMALSNEAINEIQESIDKLYKIMHRKIKQ